ncbi:MAG: beta-galactosidase [Candidatus Brocadiia bacterium]|nr:beta-galactosidase [Candidatus Brocadiia bacterium]
MRIGVAYYPEHWSDDRWPVDARMMQQMGVDVVRVGEFAWSSLEPRRERFEMDWLEQVVELLAEHGLRTIMGTPTAAPPMWLCRRHPGITPIGPNGQGWYCGSRRELCVNNSAYRKYSRRIVVELAKRFGGNSSICAWQVDNEFGSGALPTCCCDECEQAFRQWLKRRYGTIGRLNRMWGTRFWSQTFSDFHDIPVPRRTPAGPHPSLALDYRRFTSASYRAFLAEQSGIIKEYAGEDATVTTNMVPPLAVPGLNMFSLAREEDVVSVDNFPGDGSSPDEAALTLDLARSARRRAFWVMEQQAGATPIPGRAGQPRPGQLRLWSYQAAARGAEMIAYFRWRTCPAGQEMHWHGLLDADGHPGRRFQEVKATIGELKERAELWKGSLPSADVAIMLDYGSAWALEATPLGARLDYFWQVRDVYTALRLMGVQVDFVAPGRNLSDYRAVVVPMPFVCPAGLGKQLETYAAQGGWALVTAPAGYKTPENTAIGRYPPGELRDVLGVEVAEHDVLGGESQNALLFDDGTSFPTGPFCSVMELRGAEPLARYEAQYYADSPAVTVREVGVGRVYFLGALVGPDCYRALLGRIVAGAAVVQSNLSSESVEVVHLTPGSDRKRLTFVLNHSAEPANLPLPGENACQDLLTGQVCRGEVALPGYGVVLLEM